VLSDGFGGWAGEGDVGSEVAVEGVLVMLFDGWVGQGLWPIVVLMSGDELGDVRRHPVHDRVGDEHSSEVVEGVTQRPAADVAHRG
jgi:hypothetical protein